LNWNLFINPIVIAEGLSIFKQETITWSISMSYKNGIIVIYFHKTVNNN